MEEITHLDNTLRIDRHNGAAITYWSCSKVHEQIALINNRGLKLFEGSLLFPFPNRLAAGSYSFEGKTYQFEINDNDNLPNALHGLVYNQEFELVEKLENEIHYRNRYSGDNPAYPFPFKMNVRYVMSKNELELKVKICNEGSGNMPCGFGWHPYFDIAISELSCKCKMPKVSKVEVDEHLIPNGAEAPYKAFKELSSIEGVHLDNCFRLEKIDERNSVFLYYPGIGTLEIWQSLHFPFIQVYKPNEKIMAIEPMTCGLDAFNTKQGLKVLSPQQEWAFNMGLKFY